MIKAAWVLLMLDQGAVGASPAMIRAPQVWLKLDQGGLGVAEA
jgi:hypothetical protein